MGLTAEEANPAPPYETIATNIRDAVYTLDETGRITWVNEVALEAFDTSYEREDLVGESVAQVLPPDDIERCIELIEELVTTDRDSAKCEVTLLDADGREIPAELHLTLLPFEEGEFQGTIGIARDITDRKRREQRLSVLNRILRHNLRTEMNVVLGLANRLLDEADLSEPYRSDLAEIRSVATDLVELGNRARSLDEFVEREGTSRREMDLARLVRSVGERYAADHPDATFRYSLPERALVSGHDRLERALANVVENACVHTEDPTVRLSVTERDDGRVEVTVRDDGPGIPAAEVAALERGTEEKLDHGSGLGLWSTKWTVTALGGELQFPDQDDGGVVRILLPAAGE